MIKDQSSMTKTDLHRCIATNQINDGYNETAQYNVFGAINLNRNKNLKKMNIIIMIYDY